MAARCQLGQGQDQAAFVAAAEGAGLSLTLAQLQAVCASAQGLFAVAQEGGEAVAWLLGQKLHPTLEILDLVVRPSHRRRRLAWDLIQFVAEDVPPTPERLLVEVAADNGAARALYDALGFEQVGLRRGYYPRWQQGVSVHGVDALVLQRGRRP